MMHFSEVPLSVDFIALDPATSCRMTTEGTMDFRELRGKDDDGVTMDFRELRGKDDDGGNYGLSRASWKG